MAQQRTCSHCCIKIENLSVAFNGDVAVDNVNLHINCAELVAIIGPNGAGKTSLLRAIINEIPYRGRMIFQIEGRPQTHPRIGYVPQKLSIDPDSPMSVLDLVATSISERPIWIGVSRPLRARAEAILASVSAEHLIHRKLGELSGGELQRVLLALAMAPAPNLLLLDEPVSNIDPKGLSLFYKTVSDLRRCHDVAVIMVTHDLAGIAYHADTVILMNHSVLAAGPPRDILADTKLMQLLEPGPWHIPGFEPAPRAGGVPSHG
ncbi:MAG: metal ABC transporter ATP-binding protein [Candidatus Aureabacteria bacterium]|nr:metal ABC transporter ATP-binding protein [Candidatus Auribacterota bacterium]